MQRPSCLAGRTLGIKGGSNRNEVRVDFEYGAVTVSLCFTWGWSALYFM